MPKSKSVIPPRPVPDLPIAIISDVHGNAPALKAVLADIESLDVNIIVCLGDTVGYGNDSTECVRMVREACLLSVLGNHDAMLAFGEETILGKLPAHIGQPLLDTRKEVSDEVMDWIRGLTLTAAIGPMGFSHASRFQPAEFNYVFEPEDARLHFQNCPEEVSFFGHTHVPCLWVRSGRAVGAGPADPESEQPKAYEPVYKGIHLKAGTQYAVNVGSVGKPRDNDPRPCYALYNPGTRLLVFRRITIPAEAPSPESSDR